MFARGILTINPRHGASEVGTITVEHWRLEDAAMQSVEARMIEGGGDWRGTERTLEKFDQREMTENLPVVVFHTGVDPVTRVCENCGRTAGSG